MKRLGMLSVAVGMCWTLSACGGTPAPTQRMTSAQAAVRAARELGADEVPRAQLHVQLAQENIGKARKLMQDGENHRADMLLQRAAADAELSIALAKHQNARVTGSDPGMPAQPNMPPQPGTQGGTQW